MSANKSIEDGEPVLSVLAVSRADSIVDDVIEVQHQEQVSTDMTSLPDYQEPEKEAEPPVKDICCGTDEGKAGTDGSFTKGASDAADGPELTCGSDSAIEAALQAGK